METNTKNAQVSNDLTTRQRILALDAAVYVCEDINNVPGLQEVLANLELVLQEYFGTPEVGETFGQFLEEQKEACQKLADHPYAFMGWE